MKYSAAVLAAVFLIGGALFADESTGILRVGADKQYRKPSRHNL